MDQGYLAEVRLFAGNFAPRAWAFCAGQLVSIAQNQALFSLLGTTYGGDGRTTFALPDLRGRSALSPGTGPGLSTINLGQRSGVEYNYLTLNQMPVHHHLATFTATGGGGAAVVTGTARITPKALGDDGEGTDPEGQYLANTDGSKIYSTGTPIVEDIVDMASYDAPVTGTVDLGGISGTVTVQNAGGSQAIPNHSPFLGIYYIICMQGLYPSRS